jgi:hypothetical protein
VQCTFARFRSPEGERLTLVSGGLDALPDLCRCFSGGEASADGESDSSDSTRGTTEVSKRTVRIAMALRPFAAVLSVGAQVEVSGVDTTGLVAARAKAGAVSSGPAEPRNHSAFELVGEEVRGDDAAS